MHRFLMLAIALGLSFALPKVSGAVEQLTWQDLAPPIDESMDPFAVLFDLSKVQQDALYELVFASGLRQSGRIDQKLTNYELKAQQVLKAGGLDPDRMLSKVHEFKKNLETRNETLLQELDGREIKIAGYALALETYNTSITEFLLVPYVGACIHVPPPPRNQIVHVHSSEGFEGQGPFTPVWVTGRISTNPQLVNLSFVDGSSDVSTGYSLQATKIEPYEY